ncbi:DUF1223 domain-containing protein [Paracoccus sp. DK608]|uniref:DUF1223 domain-containing protein n=2 Tax=Paracoccus shanxieyensis TaxID=2675752 RepID=A0A6L6IYS6_9RHOB|nr:DUF1223 domain-containing protein [Paracoccus shanxieyensis]MTH88528.1 DUF1223 domain-containing protein [Paracoccus shanxieyensis]
MMDVPVTPLPQADVQPMPGDDPVGVSVLPQPGAELADTTSGQTAPGQTAQGASDVGLIEAPDEPPSVSAAAIPGLDDDPFADMTGMASFAERRTAESRARMAGPVGHPPVVVELFTSQGCSSCPPADAMLGDLADRSDILALSWHVDYWDYLGWADEFASPDFTKRQQAYAHAWGERGIYTPQMVVGGTDTLIALRPAELMSLLDAQMARPAPVLVTSSPQGQGYQIEVTPRARIPGRVAILLVRYAPERQVTIKAGENRGVAVTYRNVVLAVDRIADWDGRTPLRMTVRADQNPTLAAHGDPAQPAARDFPEDTRHAILAQVLGRGGDKARPTGPILAAIRLD